MAGGGGGGKTWIVVLVIGVLLVGAGMGLHHQHAGPGWLWPLLLGFGGLGVIFGSCEAMILCVDGLGKRLRWNEFVAGTVAGLASNLPELVMLAFVIANAPRVAFVVVALQLHVSALLFGVYSGLIPRDANGEPKRLPEPLIKLSTDLYAAAGGIFLAVGMLMLVLKAFDAGDHKGEGLGTADLYAIGAALLLIEVVSLYRLIKRFSKTTDPEEGAVLPVSDEPTPGMGRIVGFGLLGVAMSILGGHAVGDFSGALVEGLKERGVSEMIGAIVISIFSCAAPFLLITMAHVKGKHDIALANVSGAVTQVPFVVFPVVLILMGIFAQSGVIPYLPHGGVLAIDLETTSVLLFGFPIWLILWKSIQDDGNINWLETATMVGLFGLIVFFLAVHG